MDFVSLLLPSHLLDSIFFWLRVVQMMILFEKYYEVLLEICLESCLKFVYWPLQLLCFYKNYLRKRKVHLKKPNDHCFQSKVFSIFMALIQQVLHNKFPATASILFFRNTPASSSVIFFVLSLLLQEC